jgi:hypothetical protein
MVLSSPTAPHVTSRKRLGETRRRNAARTARAVLPDGRVLVALSQGPLVASPSWTRYDTLTNCRCAGFDINRGRQDEFDVTETGTARVYFHDRARVIDDVTLVGLQVQLQVQNPVTSAWVPQFRGVIDNITYEVDPSGVVSNVQFECVDMFDFLGGVEMVPGLFGHPYPPDKPNMGGVVYYAGGPVATGTDDWTDGGRIETLLHDAGVPSALFTVFSGNVDLWETVYDPGDSVLSAIRDAADAEWPNIANCFISKTGIFSFHGRFARFAPDTVAASASGWDFHRWKAATMEDVSTDKAQIRSFTYNRPRSRIFNAAVSWPRNGINGRLFNQKLITNQIALNTGSVSSYGYRGWSAGDLIIKEHKTNGNTGAQECKLYADFVVAAYSVPRTNIQSVTFKSMLPTDSRATANWATMLGIDISDVIALTVDEAGLVAEDYFVEGVQMTVRPGPPTWDVVEVTPNLTPAAYYAVNVFPPASSVPVRAGFTTSGVVNP